MGSIGKAGDEGAAKRAFAVIHPRAGRSDIRAVRKLLKESFKGGEWSYDVYETTGSEKLPEVVREAVSGGCDLVVVGGGDGTVSDVAEGIVGTGIPLGILPVGTGNVLARELWIPMNADKAMNLIMGEHVLSRVDAMRVGDEYYFLNVSAGFAPLMIRDTKVEHKRVFGVAAYLYHGLLQLIGFQPRRFDLEIDGEKMTYWASEVAIANSGILAMRPFNLGTNIRVNDGNLDVCVVKARSVFGYMTLFVSIVMRLQEYDRNIEYVKAKKRVSLSSDVRLAVQGDGELIGETPFEVEVVPSAVRVISPVKRPGIRERIEKFMNDKGFKLGNGKGKKETAA